MKPARKAYRLLEDAWTATANTQRQGWPRGERDEAANEVARQTCWSVLSGVRNAERGFMRSGSPFIQFAFEALYETN